jgi:uncharacterized membrane protein YphA (DoxX/SURF4 family)
VKRVFGWILSPAAAPYALAARVLVGAVLAVSGFTKLMSPPEELALVMESYKLLSPSAAMTFARILPWIEFLGGIYLIVGYMTRFMAFIASVLFMVFLFALLSAVARGISLEDCGCFGRAGPHLSPLQAALMDMFLLAASVFSMVSPHRRFSVDGSLAPPGAKPKTRGV